MDSIPVTEIHWNSILWLSRVQIKIVRLHLKRSHCKIRCSVLPHYPFSFHFSILMILSSNYLPRIGRTKGITEPTSIHRQRRIWFIWISSATRKVQKESAPENPRPTMPASTSYKAENWCSTFRLETQCTLAHPGTSPHRDSGKGSDMRSG